MKANALASSAGTSGGYDGLAKLVNPPTLVSRPPSSTSDRAFGSQNAHASHSVGAPAPRARRRRAASWTERIPAPETATQEPGADSPISGRRCTGTRQASKGPAAVSAAASETTSQAVSGAPRT